MKTIKANNSWLLMLILFINIVLLYFVFSYSDLFLKYPISIIGVASVLVAAAGVIYSKEKEQEVQNSKEQHEKNLQDNKEKHEKFLKEQEFIKEKIEATFTAFLAWTDEHDHAYRTFNYYSNQKQLYIFYEEYKKLFTEDNLDMNQAERIFKIKTLTYLYFFDIHEKIIHINNLTISMREIFSKIWKESLKNPPFTPVIANEEDITTLNKCYDDLSNNIAVVFKALQDEVHKINVRK